MPRPLVGNAGSERQTRRAAKRVADEEGHFLEALRATLGTKEGRVFVHGLLVEARVFGSVWADHGSRMAFNVGQQEYGHWLMAKCLEADEGLYELMAREARDWARREDRRLTVASRDAGTDETPTEGESTNDT